MMLILKPCQGFVIYTILLVHASRSINAEEFVLLHDLQALIKTQIYPIQTTSTSAWTI